MTRLEIQTQVVDNTRRSDKKSQINDYINLALREIGQIEPFKQLRGQYDIPMDAASNSIALPFNIIQVIQVRLLPDDLTPESGSALEPGFIGYEVTILDERTLQRRFPNLQINAQGIPEYCYVTTSTIVFVPPTSQARTVRVLADSSLPELNDDEDENPLTAVDNAVVAWATSRVFKSIQLWDDAAAWDREYAKALRLARQQDNRLPGQVRQMRGSMATRPRYIDPRINNYTRQTYGME